MIGNRAFTKLSTEFSVYTNKILVNNKTQKRLLHYQRLCYTIISLIALTFNLLGIVDHIEQSSVQKDSQKLDDVERHSVLLIHHTVTTICDVIITSC